MKNRTVFMCGYCKWFPSFFKKVVRPQNGVLYFYGILGAMKEFSNIAAFFIPLKVIMVLSNPDILNLRVFGIDEISLDSFMYYSGLWFFLLMSFSFISHIYLAKQIHRSALSAWSIKQAEFPYKRKFMRLYRLMLDTITHLLIIIFGMFSVIFLDKYLSLAILVTIVIYIVVSILLSRHSENTLTSIPWKEPKLVFKIIGDFGFVLVFIFILVEYYLNSNMNFVYTLLSILMSRIILRHLQQLFIKQRRLFDDYYYQS